MNMIIYSYIQSKIPVFFEKQEHCGMYELHKRIIMHPSTIDTEDGTYFIAHEYGHHVIAKKTKFLTFFHRLLAVFTGIIFSKSPKPLLRAFAFGCAFINTTSIILLSLCILLFIDELIASIIAIKFVKRFNIIKRKDRISGMKKLGISQLNYMKKMIPYLIIVFLIQNMPLSWHWPTFWFTIVYSVLIHIPLFIREWKIEVRKTEEKLQEMIMPTMYQYMQQSKWIIISYGYYPWLFYLIKDI